MYLAAPDHKNISVKPEALRVCVPIDILVIMEKK